MMDHLAHPDMHFVFPVVKKKAGRDVVCDEFLPQWREMLERNPYADLQEWMRMIDAGNQQPQIYVRESDEIQRKLSLKASQGGYKVMLVWLPEKIWQMTKSAPAEIAILVKMVCGLVRWRPYSCPPWRMAMTASA